MSKVKVQGQTGKVKGQISNPLNHRFFNLKQFAFSTVQEAEK